MRQQMANEADGANDDLTLDGAFVSNAAMRNYLLSLL